MRTEAPGRMTTPSTGSPPRQRFRDRLVARPILVDGGMGTLLFSRGVPQRPCLEEARTASELRVIASLTFGEERILADGSSPRAAADLLAGAGADAVGINCGAGPVACLDALEAMGRPTDVEPARSIMPNAGLS